MSETDSGFNFDWIFVREIELRDSTTDGPAAPAQDVPVDLEVQSSVSADGRACRISMILTYGAAGSGTPSTPSLRIRSEAQFSAVGDTSLTLRIFAERQAPVLMVPFVREYLSRISGLTRFGQILLNPLNMQRAVTGEMPVQR